MKQLCYLLVPLGAALIIFGIREVIGIVKVKLLYEQPYVEESSTANPRMGNSVCNSQSKRRGR